MASYHHHQRFVKNLEERNGKRPLCWISFKTSNEQENHFLSPFRYLSHFHWSNIYVCGFNIFHNFDNFDNVPCFILTLLRKGAEKYPENGLKIDKKTSKFYIFRKRPDLFRFFSAPFPTQVLCTSQCLYLLPRHSTKHAAHFWEFSHDFTRVKSERNQQF